MYSLGIIFFEMCFPFKTGMERVQTLTALRRPEVLFPSSWPVDLKPKQREIISLLLQHDPDIRPPASDLLAGPLVPSPDKEQKLYDKVIAGESLRVVHLGGATDKSQRSPTPARRSIRNSSMRCSSRTSIISTLIRALMTSRTTMITTTGIISGSRS